MLADARYISRAPPNFPYSTGIHLTDLGFGAAQIGNLYHAIDDDIARATVDAAWDGGIRYFDTVPHYGLGLSERRLGQALASRPRDEYGLSTKVGRILAPNPDRHGSDITTGGFDVADELLRIPDYTRDGVRRSLESSLQRLGTDRIDIAYVHDPENHMDDAINEAIPALIELRDQGLVRAVGVGMNYVQPLHRVVTETDVDAIVVAGRYTLIDRTGELLLDQCLDRAISVVLAAPFNSGLLAYEPAPPATLSTARAYAQLCRQNGVELPHAALQFPLRHPTVASVGVGLRTPAQVKNALNWISTSLPDSLWNKIRNTSPTN